LLYEVLSKIQKCIRQKKMDTFMVLITAVPFKKVLMGVYTVVPVFLP